MTFEVFAGAEAGHAGGIQSGAYFGTPNDSIVTPAPGGFPGTYAYCVDPVNGVVITETYGFETPLPDDPKFLTVMCMFRYTDTGGEFDDEVGVIELGSGDAGNVFSRRVMLSINEAIQVLDASEDQIGTSASNFVIKDTDYWLLWYVDLRVPIMTRDILWVYRPVVTVGPAATFTLSATANPDTIADSGSGFGGIAVGDTVTVAGSGSGNDGSYVVTVAAAGLLTLTDGDLAADESGGSITIERVAAWYKAIDVEGHDSGGPDPGDGPGITNAAITFGTSVGKGLPTQGGPCYYKEMCVQVLNKSPNTTAIGSITTRYKIPTGNGTDGDFATGSGGGGHPDWQLVDEIPSDGVTTYDEGDAAGEKQSYAITDATGVEVPLAIQVIGSASRLDANALTARTYILESSTQDVGDTYSPSHTVYGYLTGTLPPGGEVSPIIRTYNEVNGNTITNALFDGLEAGVEIITRAAGATYRVSQIGLEYMIEGPQSLPSDFPSTDVQTITTQAAGAALGSANPLIW